MNKVLLIDDDPIVIALYANLFGKKGYDVMSAGDGEAGLAALHSHRPDAVLLDLGLPKLDGVQWLDQVRADDRYRNLPVVIFTAGADSAQVKAAQKTDALFVLPKGVFSPKDVVWAIGAAIASGKRDLGWLGSWLTLIATALSCIGAWWLLAHAHWIS